MASMPYKDASADTFVGARGLYSVNIVSLVSSVLISENASSWLDPHVQLHLELRSSLGLAPIYGD